MGIRDGWASEGEGGDVVKLTKRSRWAVPMERRLQRFVSVG
jgi:hypothetical protein